MIELPASTENRLIHAAQESGMSPLTFMDSLLDEFLEDNQDIRQAELALLEPGEISHNELKAKYGL
jgi:predicted DsbA family dithiol-disulfide isomerase